MRSMPVAYEKTIRKIVAKWWMHIYTKNEITVYRESCRTSTEQTTLGREIRTIAASLPRVTSFLILWSFALSLFSSLSVSLYLSLSLSLSVSLCLSVSVSLCLRSRSDLVKVLPLDVEKLGDEQ